MDADERLDKLLDQCKSNDVDVKIDALSKLQAEFEAGIEINDPEPLINVLKTCLRTSNQHLVAATLATFPPLFPILLNRHINALSSPQVVSPSSSTSSSFPSTMVDVITLRQLLTALLPTGGLLDRLGDKERVQAKARESLVILGGLAFRSGGNSSSTNIRAGKGLETPLAIFERFLRENGLASKVWKVREQSILTLVNIRRQYHTFPIRPFLPLLVGSLEDTDAHVRDCARQSVIELFTGPAVTDGARADLKKELTKKAVRKTIVDGVLSKVLGNTGNRSGSQSREGSENGDAPREYVPPSLVLKSQAAATTNALPRAFSQSSIKDISRPASRAAVASPVPIMLTEGIEDIKSVFIASAKDLESEIRGMAKCFEGKETEHNWMLRDQSIARVRGMVKGEVHARYPDVFLACLKEGFLNWSLKTLASLRTTVATSTCSLYSELAIALGPSIDPFCELLLSNLLKMAGLTKKITSQSSQATVTVIINHSSGNPRIVIPLLAQVLQEKIAQARVHGITHIQTYLESYGARLRQTIEASGGADVLAKSIKKALSDPNPSAKQVARTCFWIFDSLWHDRAVEIINSLDSILRKQLEKACPNPSVIGVTIPSTPKPTKKSSVAAAIAASKAKAKAIATAPPTLRHQATSASSHMPVKRTDSPSPSRKTRQSMPRPSSPLRASSSPSRPRVVSDGGPRTMSAGALSTSHSRTLSGSSGRSPSPEESSFHRHKSSPLSTGSSTIRRAIQTALPSSPESNTSPTRASRKPITHVAHVTLPITRSSMFIPPAYDGEENLLLLAQKIPIPDDDSDLEDDQSLNLMSFSQALERAHTTPPTPKSSSQARSFSPKSVDDKNLPLVSNTLSSDSVSDLAAPGEAPVVEDALRARAEQAQSAAERLLELVDPDDDGMQHSSFPASLFVGSGSTNGNGTARPKNKSVVLPVPDLTRPPSTPANRSTAILREAAMFRDSPVFNTKQASLLDVLQDRKHETGWWLKRKALIAQRLHSSIREEDPLQELDSLIVALESLDEDVSVIQKLALFSSTNPAVEAASPLSPEYGHSTSPSPFASNRSLTMLQSPNIWEQNKNFDRLMNALIKCMDSTKSGEALEYGMILLWEILENQATYIEGREGEIFSLLFRVRYCGQLNVLEATNTLRDALTSRIEPVYGLTTMHASLRAFQDDEGPAGLEEAKSSTFAFGLMAIGKFVLRLPAEIAEEEIPRLKTTLITSLNAASSLVIRESAAAAIIAAQMVLQDEALLFNLLDGLADEKKNLLTYLFDKHGARQSNGKSGMEKLEKEMSRLDTRLSTPSRRQAA